MLVPEGYVVELVATGFNTPVHACFDDDGACYVSECGHKVDARPRVWKIDLASGEKEVFFELPEERWQIDGAFTGACWYDGAFYFMNTGPVDGRLSRLTPGGGIEDVVTGLGWGDHDPNYPVPGPDGKIYFGNGTVTNAGVPSAEDLVYGWLRHYPDWHDRPGADVTLAGRNFEIPDVVSGDTSRRVTTGAYVPFGTATQPGQVIPGSDKPTGSVLRWDPRTGDVDTVVWGLRNPYGIAFAPDGRLYATEHGIDERGERYVVGDSDDLYEIVEGCWYGWPDFAAGIRLDDPSWPAGRGREPVLAEHPDPDPPKPLVRFADHAGANGMSVSPDDRFGFARQAFVALFGDLAPVTTRPVTPRGFKVVRVDLDAREIVDFAVNRIEGPASKLPHDGFERPSHCTFGPDGSLYVVDWGEIEIAPEVMNIRTQLGTGALWRVRRVADQVGERPPEPTTVPLYAGQYALGAAGLAVLGWAAARGLRRLLR